MGMTVQRRKDSKFPSVIMHKVADIRGGVSVNVTELGGDYLRQGTVLSVPDEKGICHVVKTAVLAEEASAYGSQPQGGQGSHLQGGRLRHGEGGCKGLRHHQDCNHRQETRHPYHRYDTGRKDSQGRVYRGSQGTVCRNGFRAQVPAVRYCWDRQANHQGRQP